MRVLKALAQEHRIFLRLIGRIERALSAGEDAARAEVRESLLVLLPALDKHEEIEESAFSACGPIPGAGRIEEELEHEHGRVRALRTEVREALGGVDRGWDAFKPLVLALTRKLRGHFQIEELRLWPRYARAMGRSRDRTLGGRVDQEVKRLANEVVLNRLIVSDYLKGGR